MQKKLLGLASVAGLLMLSTAPFAQNNATVDPACIMKNADGVETVDKVKCPDGMKVGSGDAAVAPAAPAAAPDATATAPDAATPPDATAAPDATASTAPMGKNIIVPTESLTGATVVSANDFIGKRVYSRAGDDIGEVNDLIMTSNGSVQAVVLGVGGFLGMGEKDVAVTMASIDMTKDGESVRLVVDGTKEQFTAAPAYDRKIRGYVQ